MAMAGKPLWWLTAAAAAAAVSLLIAITLRLRIRRTKMCMNRKRLDGMVVVVTGASSGVGRAVALECARRGASVVLGCRNLESAGAVADEIQLEAGKDSNGSEVVQRTATVLRLDLGSFDSVRNFVKSFLDRFDKLDVLINNAAYLGPKASSVDGYDYCFQVNFLSHFYLTNLLIRHLAAEGRLSSASPMRVINMSSDSYVMGDINFDDVTGCNYSIYGMYATTKLAMILFTTELAARYSTRGVKSVAVHPGAVSTGLTRNWPGLFGSLLRLASPLLFRSPSEGAQSVLHCATTEDFDSIEGRLVADCRPIQVDSIARSQVASERLWMLADQMSSLS